MKFNSFQVCKFNFGHILSVQKRALTSFKSLGKQKEPSNLCCEISVAKRFSGQKTFGVDKKIAILQLQYLTYSVIYR